MDPGHGDAVIEFDGTLKVVWLGSHGSECSSSDLLHERKMPCVRGNDESKSGNVSIVDALIEQSNKQYPVADGRIPDTDVMIFTPRLVRRYGIAPPCTCLLRSIRYLN